MVLGHLRDRELRQMWKVVNEPCNSPAAQEIKERFLAELNEFGSAMLDGTNPGSSSS